MDQKKYPIRHNNHTQEEKSIIFFRNHLPAEWNINTIDRDYGQDLNIEISEDNKYKGLEFIVQLKSSLKPNILNEFENQVFNLSTFNYLWENLRVVLIVKFVEEENEAYFTLLSQIPEPNQNNETFTIKIPRNNKLSEINWDEIVEYIRDISSRKLSVVRNKNAT